MLASPNEYLNISNTYNQQQFGSAVLERWKAAKEVRKLEAHYLAFGDFLHAVCETQNYVLHTPKVSHLAKK